MRIFLVVMHWLVLLFFALLIAGALPSFLQAFTDPRSFGIADIVFFFGAFTGFSISLIGLQLFYHLNHVRPSLAADAENLPARKEPVAFPEVGIDAAAGPYVTPIGKLIWHAGGPVKQSQWDAIASDG